MQIKPFADFKFSVTEECKAILQGEGETQTFRQLVHDDKREGIEDVDMIPLDNDNGSDVASSDSDFAPFCHQ